MFLMKTHMYMEVPSKKKQKKKKQKQKKKQLLSLWLHIIDLWNPCRWSAISAFSFFYKKIVSIFCFNNKPRVT